MCLLRKYLSWNIWPQFSQGTSVSRPVRSYEDAYFKEIWAGTFDHNFNKEFKSNVRLTKMCSLRRALSSNVWPHFSHGTSVWRCEDLSKCAYYEEIWAWKFDHTFHMELQSDDVKIFLNVLTMKRSELESLTTLFTWNFSLTLWRSF